MLDEDAVETEYETSIRGARASRERGGENHPRSNRRSPPRRWRRPPAEAAPAEAAFAEADANLEARPTRTRRVRR